MKQKKNFILLASFALIFLLGCENNQPSQNCVNYHFKTSALILSGLKCDTICAEPEQKILFFITNFQDSIVPAQINFGDGLAGSGKQIWHQYSSKGIYKISAKIIGTNIFLDRIIKISTDGSRDTSTQTKPPIVPDSSLPGSYGDTNKSGKEASFRFDYKAGSIPNTKDTLILYANCYYLGKDSAKMGISYSVDGGGNYFVSLKCIKNSSFAFCKILVNQVSSVRFCSYKNLTTFEIGDMTNSVFYKESLGDCFLTISGTIKKASATLIKHKVVSYKDWKMVNM